MSKAAVSIESLKKVFGILDNQKPFRIWTQSYSPFSFGGVHTPVACVVTSYSKPVDLGLKIKGYVVLRPDGTTAVVEPNGGIVGDSVLTVRQDLWEANAKDVQRQMAESKERNARATLVSEAEFWERMGVKPIGTPKKGNR